MGGRRKNSRHNLHWHCRDAPVSSWHSATCCHTEPRDLLSYPAAIHQTKRSKTFNGFSTLLQVFETHRSLPSSVYVHQVATDCVPWCCPWFRQNQAKGSQHTRRVISPEATLKTEVCSVVSQELTYFTLDTSSPRNVPRVRLRYSWKKKADHTSPPVRRFIGVLLFFSFLNLPPIG